MQNRGLLSAVSAVVLIVCHCHAQSNVGQTPAGLSTTSRPLLLEKNEGELRTRRPRPKPSPASQFLLKVDSNTSGSQHLVVGTEEIAPGAAIPTHKHPMEDEVVLINSGVAHVHVGEQERDLHSGGLVFIPANTWVGLKNTSTKPLSITFIFSAPGFDEFQRCISVPAGQTAKPMTQEELKRCQAPGHMIYK